MRPSVIKRFECERCGVWDDFDKHAHEEFCGERLVERVYWAADEVLEALTDLSRRAEPGTLRYGDAFHAIERRFSGEGAS